MQVLLSLYVWYVLFALPVLGVTGLVIVYRLPRTPNLSRRDRTRWSARVSADE
jgi:hypothetical protein